MTRKRGSTRQLVAFDDDILIPPPRKAAVWYCNKCGEPTGVPEPGFLSVDARYAYGTCPCTPPRRNRVSGYKHEKVNLIADFAWDRETFNEQRERRLEKLAFEREHAGQSLKPEDIKRAARYRIRNGLPDRQRI